MNEPDGERASILIPIVLSEDDLPRLILIRRAETVSHHRGQIAFPGGRFEPDRDDGLLAAAVREAHEEIGLKPADVRIIGTLNETRTLTSNFLITPFVGVVPPDYCYLPDPREVQQILEVPLAQFDPSRGRVIHRWTRGTESFAAPAVCIREDLVWGATLNIIDDLWRHRGEFFR